MPMDVEQEVRRNADDIHQLALTVTKVAQIVENAEKRRDSDMDTIKKAVEGIEKLNERMAGTVAMEKDVAGCREMIAEQKGEIGKLRHDVANALNALGAIPKMNEKISDVQKEMHDRIADVHKDVLEKITDVQKDVATNTTDIATIKTWKDRRDGALGALRDAGAVFWTIFGGAILAGIYFLARMYFTAGPGALGAGVGG